MMRGPTALHELLGVDETAVEEVKLRLKEFERLVQKWNPAINVVAKSTLHDIWNRHILDSVQLFRFCPDVGVWLDLGSGGGFPGLVIAILAKEYHPEVTVRLVESDQRKAVFLREASRHLELGTDVLCERIERLPPQAADVVSARALAPLDMLLDLAQPHLGPDGVCVFLKGGRNAEEITAAARFWHFDLKLWPSHTSEDSSILEIGRLRHV